MPTIPGLASGFVKGNWPQLSPQDAVDILTKLLSQDKNTLVLTGAGLSVDSGIRAYRGALHSARVWEDSADCVFLQAKMAHTQPRRTIGLFSITSKPSFPFFSRVQETSRADSDLFADSHPPKHSVSDTGPAPSSAILPSESPSLTPATMPSVH